jgi:uncharacterized protein with ParB-like and HNH nuclease domain/alkylated DNA nucleotide flippase Atl1
VKAVDANLLELLKKCTQFVVPIYQRAYSWGESECNKLWEDLVRAGARTDLAKHFTGSIVYIEKGQGTTTAAEPDLIIDGQQRITTVTLLLAALAKHLDARPEKEREPVNGFAPEKIRGLYLTNVYESGEAYFKLVLSKSDKDALKSIIRNSPIPDVESRIPKNYQLLQTKIATSGVAIKTICQGLSKLVVVDVRLTRGIDDPQLVFESMNSTGKKLSQADLIRNFVLMDLPPTQQSQMYEDYWYPIEDNFKGDNESVFDEFVRHFLTLNTGQIPRLDDIYEAFKSYAFELQSNGTTRDALVRDLWQHAEWFGAIALGHELKRPLKALFAEIVQLRASVVYPFLLRLYKDYQAGVLTEPDLRIILESVISYVFRRSVCRIPTNSLNKTFASLGSAIDPNNYVESVWGRLLTLPTYKRFPTDDEFSTSLQTSDLYHFRRTPYFFRKLENHGRKEEVSTSEYTIEHIMPQNEDLSEDWREALGANWQEIHKRYLHTLGNLTLTGYNPEYSDRPFSEKRDIDGGFKMSPLRLNQGLGQLHSWNSSEIEKRAKRLAVEAIKIWGRPHLSVDALAGYRARYVEKDGFDWSMTHAILAAIPAGKWTSYHQLAEAVGTAAQALGNHMTSCGACPNPHRVLTWDGRVADSFRWSSSDEKRHPSEILTNEGIRFEDRHADKAQQLLLEDLLSLVGELDE